jgi:hypothetical protein
MFWLSATKRTFDCPPLFCLVFPNALTIDGENVRRWDVVVVIGTGVVVDRVVVGCLIVVELAAERMDEETCSVSVSLAALSEPVFWPHPARISIEHAIARTLVLISSSMPNSRCPHSK